MKYLTIILTLILLSKASFAKIPELFANLSKVEILESSNDSIRFKASGSIRLFVVATKKNQKDNWVRLGQPAQFINLQVQDGEFTVSKEDGIKNWDSIIALLKESKPVTISIHKAQISIDKGLVSKVVGNGIQKGSPLNQDQKRENKSQ